MTEATPYMRYEYLKKNYQEGKWIIQGESINEYILRLLESGSKDIITAMLKHPTFKTI